MPGAHLLGLIPCMERPGSITGRVSTTGEAGGPGIGHADQPAALGKPGADPVVRGSLHGGGDPSSPSQAGSKDSARRVHRDGGTAARVLAGSERGNGEGGQAPSHPRWVTSGRK